MLSSCYVYLLPPFLSGAGGPSAIVPAGLPPAPAAFSACLSARGRCCTLLGSGCGAAALPLTGAAGGGGRDGHSADSVRGSKPSIVVFTRHDMGHAITRPSALHLHWHAVPQPHASVALPVKLSQNAKLVRSHRDASALLYPTQGPRASCHSTSNSVQAHASMCKKNDVSMQ
jgi:hypothetical protein